MLFLNGEQCYFILFFWEVEFQDFEWAFLVKISELFPVIETLWAENRAGKPEAPPVCAGRCFRHCDSLHLSLLVDLPSSCPLPESLLIDKEEKRSSYKSFALQLTTFQIIHSRVVLSRSCLRKHVCFICKLHLGLTYAQTKLEYTRSNLGCILDFVLIVWHNERVWISLQRKVLKFP